MRLSQTEARTNKIHCAKYQSLGSYEGTRVEQPDRGGQSGDKLVLQIRALPHYSVRLLAIADVVIAREAIADSYIRKAVNRTAL
jgi:hypothetical protein